MAKSINLMIGTSPEGQGGIATVIRGYVDYGLFQTNNIHFIATHHTDIKSRFGMMLFYFGSLLKLIWLALTHKLGWAHVHMASRGSYMRKRLIVSLARKLGAKIIIHLHGAEFHIFYTEVNPERQQEIARFFSQADKVLALSEHAADWIESISGRRDNIDVLYNTVPDFNVSTENRSSQCILFLGHIGDRKGIFDLVPAFAKLLKDYPHAELRIGGVGEMERLQSMIKELDIEANVKLLGWVVGEQKEQELAQADIFCLPSNNEAMPMGVLEAMSAGMTIVTTPVGGVPEIIHHDQNGLLFTPGDQDALYDCMSQIFADEEKKQALGKAAKQYFAEHLSEKVILSQLQKVYRELE